MNCYQIRLLRLAIENCKAWIKDAEEVDELLKGMYRTAVGKVLE